jgi:hypothetical protein
MTWHFNVLCHSYELLDPTQTDEAQLTRRGRVKSAAMTAGLQDLNPSFMADQLVSAGFTIPLCLSFLSWKLRMVGGFNELMHFEFLAWARTS